MIVHSISSPGYGSYQKAKKKNNRNWSKEKWVKMLGAHAVVESTFDITLLDIMTNCVHANNLIFKLVSYYLYRVESCTAEPNTD